MHFSGQIWDFFERNRQSSLSSFGTYAFAVNDPYYEQIIKYKVKKDLQGEQSKFLLASEVTASWLSDNLNTMDLFGTKDSLFIQNAEQLSSDVQSLLLSSIPTDRFIVLYFSKTKGFFEKLKKDDSIQSTEIQAARFWEFTKLFDFLAGMQKIRFSYEAKTYILDSCENETSEFVNLMRKLRIDYPNQEIDIEIAKKVVVLSKMDKFELANLYSSKKQSAFFEKIIHFNYDASQIRELFYFMQTHFVKIFDTSFLDKKKKLTQYDRSIVAYNKAWSDSEIEQALDFFAEGEFLAKVSSDKVLSFVKESYLKSLA